MSRYSPKLVLATTFSLFLFASGCQFEASFGTDSPEPSSSTSNPFAGKQSSESIAVAAQSDVPILPASGSPSAQPSETAAQPSDQDVDRFFTLLDRASTDDERLYQEAAGEDSTLELALAACQDLEAGFTFDQVIDDLVQGLQSGGLEGEELNNVAYYSGKVIGAGIATFCPQYLSEIS